MPKCRRLSTIRAWPVRSLHTLWWLLDLKLRAQILIQLYNEPMSFSHCKYQHWHLQPHLVDAQHYIPQTNGHMAMFMEPCMKHNHAGSATVSVCLCLQHTLLSLYLFAHIFNSALLPLLVWHMFCKHSKMHYSIRLLIVTLGWKWHPYQAQIWLTPQWTLHVASQQPHNPSQYSSPSHTTL